MKNCEAQSPSSNDTLCFPVSVIQKVLIAAEQKKVLVEQVSILDQRIIEKEAIIRGFQAKDSVNNQIVQTYVKEIDIMKNQRATFESELKSLNKALRKQRHKTFWTAMAGVAATTAAVFLFK